MNGQTSKAVTVGFWKSIKDISHLQSNQRKKRQRILKGLNRKKFPKRHFGKSN